MHNDKSHNYKPEQGSNSQGNAYAKAADAYGDHARKHTPNDRELEARVLLKAAKMIQTLQDDWDNIPPDQISKRLEEPLHFNRQIWMMFYNTAIEGRERDGDANPLRDNIINLSNFIFKRESEITSSPTKDQLDALISINKQISSGLMTQG